MPNHASDDSIKTSILRWPESPIVRVLLGFVVLINIIFLVSGFTALWVVVGLFFLFSILWIANRFEKQEAQISELYKQLEDLKFRIYQADHTKQPLADKQDKDVNTPFDVASPDNVVVPPIPSEQNGNLSPDENIESSVGYISQPYELPAQQVENIQIAASNVDIEPIPKDDYRAMTSLWQAAISWFKGGNSIVRIAVIILLIGVILLLRFAGEYWQLTLGAKMSGIAVAGVGVTALGYVLRKKRFEYAVSLQGLGLGILFLVLFSSYHLGVISSVVIAYIALLALLGITLLMALKQNALILAFIALSSGFIAPFILTTENNDIPALMGYLFVLNAALAVIALFKPWRILNTVALLLTFGIGGLAIWQYAVPEQHTVIAIWVWLIFALYLFISIRDSQHVVQIHSKFKDIPLVDSTLIFATPFMAFSLYAGLVDSENYRLSIASSVLALVYFAVAYFLHQKAKHLSVLIQCFYGLGFVFTALILPFIFDAYWTSVGWAIHGIAMLALGWRYQLRSAKYFSIILLVASGLASLFAAFWDNQPLLFAACVLMSVYALAYYFFRKPYQPISEHADSTTIHELDRLIANLFLFASFMFVPYVYNNLCDKLGYSISQHSAGLLIWLGVLSIGLYWKDRKFYNDWRSVTMLVLALTALFNLDRISYINYPFNLVSYHSSESWELIISDILWCSAFVFFVKKLFLPLQIEHIGWKIIRMVFSAFAVLCLAHISAMVLANPANIYYLIVFIPIIVLVFSLYYSKLFFIQDLWIKNIAVMALMLMWLWWSNISYTGEWFMPYFPALNPIDVMSLMVFGLLTYAMKPYLFAEERTTQLITASVLLVTGLFLVSSILLRVLYHYAALPYWSWDIWQNSTVQMSFTILWALIALVLTSLASKKAWRYIWMLGIAVLGVVIAKLIFLDLSHSHTLTRIISFIASGLIMLVIGYFAPLPPKAKSEI